MKKSFTSLACIVLSTTFLYSQTDLGPNAPGTFANNSSVGVINWTDMSEAATSDGDYAIATAALLGTNSHYLVLTGFNFSVPDGSTINGIEVEVEQFSSKVLIVIGSLFVSDNSVRLVKGGSLVGSDYATTDQ